MNQVVKEMKAIIDGETLIHYGMPRRSGRYPYGSGEDPYQHNQDFLSRVEDMRKKGITYTDPKTGKTYKGDTAIAKTMGLSTTQFRTEIGLAKDERRILQVNTAKALQKDGLGPTAIGKKMGINESTVRSLLNEESALKMEATRKTADNIREMINTKGPIMLGSGVERELGMSKEKLNQAIAILELEGYEVKGARVAQATNPGQMTTVNAIFPPGSPKNALYEAIRTGNIHTITDYVSPDGGDTINKKFTYPESLDPKRIMVRYADDVGPDGFRGIEKDGTVELRPGVADLSLGDKRYSQVRIMVNGTHYIKGMAFYGDDKDFPPGVDVIFNTNKNKDKPLIDVDSPKQDNCVLKPIKKDPDNPFGSLIKDADLGGQYWYDDKTGKVWDANNPVGNKKLGLINKRADEGDWTEWKDSLPSQFLSKQSLSMAKKQLDLAAADKFSEFDDICSLNNPTVKKHLLQKFSDECDSAAVHLQAAALPGQKYHVIIPNNTLKENEIYAPGYESGTKLALVRYPHGGTFEIPICTVNNKNALGKKIIGPNSIDAVCINAKVAERLSGADFDGDTVMCIPTHDPAGKVKISSRDNLPGLVGFDPKISYPERPGMKYMKDPVTGKDATQMEMGKISNLITDMTLAGAGDEKLAAAVRHSMVVIDAGKHKLDYKKSEIDNNIAALQKEYQAHYDKNGNLRYGGASTIISRASGETSVVKRQGSPVIDPETGKLSYKVADDAYFPVRKFNKDGTNTITTKSGKRITYNPSDPDDLERYDPVKKVDSDGTVRFTNKAGDIEYKTDYRKQQSTKMAETDNAYTLVSEARHPMEIIYADYANTMKSLGNQARKEMMSTGKIAYDANAAKTYSAEVKSLKDKLNTALLNAPRERLAQIKTNAEVEAKKAADPTLKPGDIRKLSQQALTKYRSEVQSVARSKRSINISDREWEAIQAGAISESKLKDILNNTDVDSLRDRATPKTRSTLSTSKINTIKAMSASNYTLEQIAKKLGVSTSTVHEYLNGKKGVSG